MYFIRAICRHKIYRNESQLQGAAKGLDACLPRDDTVVKVCAIRYNANTRIFYLPFALSHQNAPQLDARGSSFTDVGRDQHQNYHINVIVCPHASSRTTRHGAETSVCEL